jgi:hypothetical protein
MQADDQEFTIVQKSLRRRLKTESLIRLHGTDANGESGSTLLNLEQIIPVQAVPSERGLL